MKNKILTIIPMCLMFICLTVTVCLVSNNILNDDYDEPSDTTNNITNNITNEITNKVVEYENITVEDLQSAVVEAVKMVENAVIGVTCKAMVSLDGTKDEVEQPISTGSGVIYKREEVRENGKLVNYRYYVITNRHVILSDEYSEDKCLIYTYLGEEDKEFKATVLGYDKKVDIAVLTFEYSRLIQPVVMGKSSELEKGGFVIAVGNPYGYDYYGSATFGIVSGTERYMSTDTDGDGVDDFYGTYIQHDVAINSGNSGGGLFNIKGELVGINTLKLVTSNVENIGFAIPSDMVNLLITEYIEPGKEIVRPRLGISGYEVRELTPAGIIQNNLKDIPDIYNGETPYGVYINGVSQGATMENSGIQVDDILLSINGVKITRMYIINHMLNSLMDLRVGESVEIEYYSRATGEIKTISVVLKP